MSRKNFPLWNEPPHELNLAGGEVHLWRISLDLPATLLDELECLLNEEERARADRLLDAKKANAFIAARGRLRQVLARYLHLSPEEVSFAYNPHGKPYLRENKDIRFNLSHSGPWALIAVTKGMETGVDLEWIDPVVDYEKIASQFFSPSEKELLMSFPLARRRRAFYRIWTKKEAALKCLGQGFNSPKEAEEELSKRFLWYTTFPVEKGYIGSLAVEGDVDLLRKWELL